MTRIGITGGIGSGKSVVSELLRLMGIPVYDTDSKAKQLQTTDEKLKKNIKDILGDEAYLADGSLNKPYIAGKIFTNSDLLGQVNAAVHPAVREDFEEWVTKQQEKGYKIVGLESAILHQANLHEQLDTVWNVDSPVELRIERACRRDNKKREQIEARIRNQKSTITNCDAVIKNDDNHSLITQVENLVEKLRKSVSN